MSRTTIPISLLLLATLLIPLQGGAQAPPSGSITVEELQRLIDAAGGGWVAGETSVSQLSPKEQRYRLGLVPEALDPALLSRMAARATPATATSLPPCIDWRDHNGNWTTPIRDQDRCGSCVAFGTLGAIESRLEIYHDDPNENPDLSEQHLFFCGGGDCENGWYPSAAMNFAQDIGVADEPCDPYDADEHACFPCLDWQDRVTKIHCWYSVSGREDVKSVLVNHGPVEAVMEVYEDFYFYAGGVYRYTEGDYKGGHAVTLVGYDDSGGYWIAKNSWGTGWGESGWFRADYGDVIYDFAYVPVFDQVPPGKARDVRPDGWSGPYTKDTTPSFRWDPADDDGCGIQGYYVAVDDWTPEGSGGNDWWVGNSTTFTVLSAPPEGEHIFAVTAVDVGDNANPTDTDQPGDAPYYTFYVDTTPPQSQVAPLPPESAASFTVSWSGSDAISGVISYDVQVRDEDSPWQDWKIDATGTSATFPGTPGHTYCFRSRARDQAGNEEAWPSNPDACTTVQMGDLLPGSVHLPLILHNYTYTPSPPPARYPDDPYYSSQWALEKVNAPTAWGISTGRSVHIAVLDTGTDLDHPDLADKARTDIDWDFANDDADADDDHGHGTHVSGIAAAATDNGLGVAGLGWEGMILPLKVLGANGYGSDTDLAAAIRYAADNGAGVINMSLGAPSDGGCPWYLQDAVDYAYAKGVVLVAAAGNHEGSTPNAEMCPANCEHVLGVAATERDDSVAAYSNYGTHVSVAAPGSSIFSTLMDSRYGNGSGTSMATPHVAGLAALLRARYPAYTPDQIASAILDNAEDLGAAGWNPYAGCGRIDAFQALSVGAHSTAPVCLEQVEPHAADTGGTSVNARFAAGEIIVSFRPGINAETASRRHGASAEFLSTIQAWRLWVPPGQERATLARLQADPAVARVDLNYLVSAQ
jgi:subtilisin family serine protease/C1A family cysteine protease